jgi:hypothetical protein
MWQQFVIPLLFLGLGAAGFFVAKFATAYFESKKGRDFVAWQYELETDVLELVRARLYVAACEQRLASFLRELPQEFVPEVFMAARLGYAVERTVLREAEKRGLYDPRADVPLPQSLREEEPAPATSRTMPSPAPEDEGGPDTVWQGSKLVPIKRSKVGP